MKMRAEDFERLKKLIEASISRYPTAQKSYVTDGKSHTRFVWDVWHATVNVAQKAKVEDYLWMRGLHDYLNDDHIETALKKIIPETETESLDCCCCGGGCKGRQWHNRDTGYGLCPKCATWIAERESPEYMQECYGMPNVHYFTEEK